MESTYGIFSNKRTASNPDSSKSASTPAHSKKRLKGISDQLPDEILVKIFSFFEDMKCYALASYTCKRWHHVSHDPRLLTKVGIKLSHLADHIQAKNMFEKAAAQEHARAIYALGLMYLKGEGVEKNYKKAVPYFLKSFELGFKRAVPILGQAYFLGLGTAKNPLEAKKFLEITAKEGDSLSMYFLGRMYLDDEYGMQDLSKGIDYLEKAGDLGHLEAMGYLALTYDSKCKNYDKAIELWYRLLNSHTHNMKILKTACSDVERRIFYRGFFHPIPNEIDIQLVELKVAFHKRFDEIKSQEEDRS